MPVLSTLANSYAYYPQYTLREAILGISIYEYLDTTTKSAMRSIQPLTAEVKLKPDGSNLASTINRLSTQHPKQYQRFKESLKNINPAFDDVRFDYLPQGLNLILIEAMLDSGIFATHISDGTLRYMCMLAILLNPERGTFVCIDEPEIGLHPDMLHGISEAIQVAGKESTVLLATHSSELLDNFDFHELLVVDKEEGSSKVKTFSEKEFSGWYESFSLGKMWREGDFGGNRW